MFKKPFSFEGRIRRTEFGLSYIIYIAGAGIISVLMDLGEATSFFGLGFIPLIWFFLAQGVKRCHDRGNSGWYLLIPFYVFWMLFADSHVGENEYGPNPKGIGNTDEIDEIGKHLVG
jgi:uncharacterized membrane protein YhaH (DUF805 family)